jgi:hypothetical protein
MLYYTVLFRFVLLEKFTTSCLSYNFDNIQQSMSIYNLRSRSVVSFIWRWLRKRLQVTTFDFDYNWQRLIQKLPSSLICIHTFYYCLSTSNSGWEGVLRKFYCRYHNFIDPFTLVISQMTEERKCTLYSNASAVTIYLLHMLKLLGCWYKWKRNSQHLACRIILITFNNQCQFTT